MTKGNVSSVYCNGCREHIIASAFKNVLAGGSNPGVIASADIVDLLRYEGEKLAEAGNGLAHLLARAADTIERLRSET